MPLWDRITGTASQPLMALAAFLVAALVLVATLMAKGTPQRVSRRRLNPAASREPGAGIRNLSDRLRSAVGTRLSGRTTGLARKLDVAGFGLPAQEYVVWVAVGTAIATIVLGISLGAFGAVLGLTLGLGGAYLVVEFAVSRARHRFADQLDENLQILAGSLRAGYSLMQALGTLAGEDGVAPSRDEFARVINQARLGRPVGEALAETATRMDSVDFRWVADAIAINREVGGNLATVLDGVSHTIRERGSLRRQVRALAAEGKLSAIILGGLPVLVAMVVGTMNPLYFNTFFTTGLWGYGLIGLCVVLMTLGIVTLRATIRIKI